ncbi:chromosome segregation protein SMC [Moraxella catarrhalis]|uniref:Chromosome partition protein Smc n=1 Tax=Moraxella catarrhalis TaxID=480 RepID=A0A198UH93_MORCA|nr:chromosome segregation protein SMC [Moraxella catarrhalis]OAU95823.1 Chromosome partition protein smc [Moraxella catarrhalis]OAU97881.1 Chromosome partition protein smc [Moraxella catarrhalis]OAV04036.1 Chromosome partition protein smc [Moraxella catarrhalis]
MRLKSLKLAGFKSFANPTTFTFRHDITAIVGPNGCGKSNVIDAIRWVLGETSAKQLRGGAMSDVIFAGVEGRAAKSLASVELIFEHTQDETHGIRHELNLYQELSLRRQVTKEGKSDYFINGQRVRRRDVVDVFLGTGLGARSYAVIEQGMIGRIVESSPMQLREFIEEGAGVSRYQVRRADTEKKLSETQDNLKRLSDLQGELKKQHKTLIRQAESAKQYQALTDELKVLQKDDLIRRLFEAWRHHEQKKGEQSKSSETLAKLEAEANQVRRELDVLSARVAEAQWLKDEAKDNYHNAQMAEQTAQHNFYTVNSQIAQNDEKIARLNAQHHDALTNIEHAQDELLQINQSLDLILPETETMTHELNNAKQTQSEAQMAWQSRRDELNGLIQEKNNLENLKKLAQSQRQRLEAGLTKWQARYDELVAAKSHFSDTTEAQKQLSADTLKAAALRQKLEHLNDDEALKSVVEELRVAVQTSQAHVQSQEKRHASLMGEYEILHKLTHTKVQSNKITMAPDADALTALNALPSLKESLALTGAGLAHADILDQFLGFWLSARLSDDLPTAFLDHAMDDNDHVILKSGKKSDAGIVSSSIHANEVISQLPTSLQQQLVRFDRLFSAPTLELFGRCYLYVGDEPLTDLQTGALLGVMIVTKAGWLVGSFGMMHLSKLGDTSSQFLSDRKKHLERLEVLEDELNTLEDSLEKDQKQFKQAMTRLQSSKIELEEVIAQKHAATQQLHQLEQSVTTLTAKLDSEKSRRESIDNQLKQLDDENDSIKNELQELKVEIDTCELSLSELEPKFEQANQAMAVQTARIEEAAAKLKAQNDSYQALQIKLGTLTQAKTHAERLLEMAKHSASQTQADIETTKSMQQELSQKLPVLEEAFKAAKAVSHELKLASDEYELAAKAQQIAQSQLQETLTEAHTKFATAQAALAQISADTAVGESRVQDIGGELMRLDESFNLASKLADFRTNSNQNFTDNSARQNQIKIKITELGAVNLAAAAELAELEARVSPMDEQINDITQSMKKLQDAIRAIDEKTKTLFLTALEAVNKELNALFSKVFGGGQASLTLMADDDLPKSDKWRAGLVLMAQPKGKKNSRLAVLSGGEKTLTALSLIFAIFKQHPAPFCVLDEVDAPLDDANVARFTGLIRELADDVQFIFISHNKLAMQIADELKGITMPTAGISSLVTVDLQEAQKYLEIND